MGRRVDERGGAGGQTGLLQGGIESVLDDRTRGPERVRPDAEDHGVAAPQHAAGIREHVGTSLEDERDDAQPVAEPLETPTVMVELLDDLAPGRGQRRPGPQSRDHVGPHPVRQDQPGDRAPPGPRTLHILGVGRRDRREAPVVLQPPGERLEEPLQVTIRDLPHRLERVVRRVDRPGGGGPIGGRHVQDLTGILEHDDRVTWSEGGRQLLGDVGDAVPAEDQRGPGGQCGQGLGAHGAAR
jgi:hypothetical protein